MEYYTELSSAYTATCPQPVRSFTLDQWLGQAQLPLTARPSAATVTTYAAVEGCAGPHVQRNWYVYVKSRLFLSLLLFARQNALRCSFLGLFAVLAHSWEVVLVPLNPLPTLEIGH